MSYEISESTMRILKKSKSIAMRAKLSEVNTLCLLLSLIDEETIVKVFKALHVEIETLREVLESKISRTAMASPSVTLIDEENIALDAACSRVLKLSVLEYKLSKGLIDDAVLLCLAILHDRSNDAKSLLANYRVDYSALRSIALGEQPTADYASTNDGDVEDPFPGEGSEGDSFQSTDTKTAEGKSDTPVIDNFSTDLTALAQKGALDPVLGREKEIERMMQILCRRKKNNPIIIGEPGVGKSAIVEGLAINVSQHKVPRLLQGKRIVSLDMAAIVAGTQYRGQFEERLRRLIKEIKAHPEIVLFVDEIHTIIGAGASAGSLDAANILKPALARGEIQCIGATTISEFKKTIEKDGALDRRFQKVMLEPTTPEQTYEILKNIKERYEEHHNVKYTDEALHNCVALTNRYISDRALPDKAIDALDEAGSRKHLETLGAPKEIEEQERLINETRERKLSAARDQNYELAANLRDEVAKMTAELERMTREWQENQKSNPEEVTADDIARVVSLMSGVPANKVAKNENERLKGLADALRSKVIAQDEAVTKLTRAIIRNRIGLKGNDRPIGTFLFVGPTGVGKTHLVKCLAEWLFGNAKSLIRIDMSEYGEKHSVSRLIGAPPGYVGYEEGGQLTEQVRRHPYSVVLLDEIEKAHGDVFNTLLQVMDEGRLTDGNGTTIDFRNTIIIMTSNSGSRQIKEFGQGVGFNRLDSAIDGKTAESIVRKALSKQFSPEFLNRLDDIIMFNPLTKDNAHTIAQLELDNLAKRLKENEMTLTVSDDVKQHVVDKGFDAQFGARSLKRAIQHEVEDALCDYIVEHPDKHAFHAEMVEGKVAVSTKEQD